MKSILSSIVLSCVIAFTLLASSGCQHTPPNLSPQAVVAFHQTQVVGYLDNVRDAADRAHKTVPPLITAQTELKVVTWHESAIKIVHDAKGGWVAAVSTSLDELKKNLSPSEVTAIGPYIDAAKLVIQEVQ